MATRPSESGHKSRSAHQRGKRSTLNEEDDVRLANIGSKSGSTPRKYSTRGLACPFLKAFPDTPQWNLNGTCARHSWPTIPRLKEHLYRCHAQHNLSCPRCVASFEKQHELDEHLRSQVPCKVANRKDGLQQTINPVQIDKLRRRKGLYGQDPVQKWYEIWDILFPTHPRPPSPYADDQDGLWKWDVHHVMKKNFHSFMEKRLPETVVENFRKESIVAESGSNQDSRIKELISQSLDTAIREYESGHSEHTDTEKRSLYSQASTGSRETIRAGTSSGSWDYRRPNRSTASRKSADNEVEDKESPDSSKLSRSTASDSSLSSYEPSLASGLNMEVSDGFDIYTAGVGGFAKDFPFPSTNEQSHRWSQPDGLLTLPGISSFSGFSPSLNSETTTCGHRPCFPNTAVLNSSFSLETGYYEPGETWSPFSTADPDYGSWRSGWSER